MPRKAAHTAGHALRILHRGRDQVVEVEVLDIEGLAHMRAARLQELHHLRLILDPIELGFDLVRRGGHLAQRERGGENLDEEGVHWGAVTGRGACGREFNLIKRLFLGFGSRDLRS